MHANDILRYGHLTVMKAVEDLSDPAWQTAGACGDWSVKDIVAHLSSYETVLAEVAHGLQDPDAKHEALDRFTDRSSNFNDSEVAKRADLSPQEVLQEYESACAAAQEAVAELPDELLTKTGALTWYGDNYDLDDFLVYTFYGHKREHCAQIAAFRERMKA